MVILVVQWFDFVFEGAADGVWMEDAVGDVDKNALEFLGEAAFPHAAFLGFEEIGGNARALLGGYAEFRPLFALRGVPFCVEEAAFALGSAEEPDGSVGDGEHGEEGVIDFVFDAGGFVDDEQRDGGESANGVFIGGNSYYAGTVLEIDGEFVATERHAAEESEIADFAHEFAGLLLGGRCHYDGAVWADVG